MIYNFKKRIKISAENKVALQAALDHAQDGARVRIATPESLIELAGRAEARLAEEEYLVKSEYAGARYVFGDIDMTRYANSYRYAKEATQVTIERGGASWYLIAAGRRSYYVGQDGDAGLRLNADQVEAAAQRFKKTFKTYDKAAA